MSTVNNITYEQVAAVQEPTSSSSPAPQPTSTLNGGSALANALAWLQNNPIYDPTSTIELKSPPPDGLNTDPRDCFGVSSNPDVAEQQLLDLMEWTREGGFDKRNCALIWVCAMIGFDMRINQWNAEGLGNDPSVLTIESTLADLTNVQDDQGQSLSDMVVQNLAAMVLYGAYDHNGGNVAAANQTVIKALTMANDAYL